MNLDVELNMKKTTLYRDGDSYVLATGESPKGFKGFLFITWTGPTPDALGENVTPLEDLKKLEKVEDVPDEWRSAFIDKGLLKPEPVKPVKRKKRRKVSEADEFVGHMAAGTDPVTAAVVSGVIDKPSLPVEPLLTVVEPTRGQSLCRSLLVMCFVYVVACAIGLMILG